MTAPRFEPAAIDVEHLDAIRRNVEALQKRAIAAHLHAGDLVLDVAPQAHAGVRPLLPEGVALETLDLDPAAGATYTADLCEEDSPVPAGRFAMIFCTEVLEHTLQPFDAARELHRMLAPGGRLVLSVPFNFRIHGPLPDCWRFTEHGLRSVLRAFELEALDGLETPDRPLMPIHYTVIARKPPG